MTLASITVINVSSVEWFSHVTLATNPPIHHFIFEKMLQSASIHLEQHFCELKGSEEAKSNSVGFITCLSNPGKGKHMSQWNMIKFRLSVDILPHFNLSHKMNHIKVYPNSVCIICYMERLLFPVGSQCSSLFLHFFFQLPIRIVASLLPVYFSPMAEREACHWFTRPAIAVKIWVGSKHIRYLYFLVEQPPSLPSLLARGRERQNPDDWVQIYENMN